MTSAASDPNRRRDGTFAPGNNASLGISVGKGQSAQEAKRRKNKYSAAIEECVTREDMHEVAIRALEDAKGGDRWARDWITDYLIGRPVKRVEQVEGEKDPLSLLLGEFKDNGADE